MNGRRIALDSIVVLGLFFFLLGFASFYVMFIGPNHGGFVSCSEAVGTSCYPDPVSGGFFTFLTLIGGPASLLAAAHYRKNPKMSLWESVLLGYIVILLFDLIILPTNFLPILPPNGGGILILAFFVMSLAGIIFSGFKYIQENQSNLPSEPRRAPFIPASSKRKNTYAFVFIVALLLGTSLWVWPLVAYGGQLNFGCPVEIGALSFQISSYSQLVGPPMFSQEQFVMTPGSATYLTEIWDATNSGNNVTDWFTRPPNPNRFTITSLSKIDPITGELHGVYLNQTGVTDTFLNISYQGIHIARILYKISVSNSAEPASYELYLYCDFQLIMTVGQLPYWGPLPYGEIQPMALLFNIAVSLVGASILVAALHLQSAHRTEEDKSAMRSTS